MIKKLTLICVTVLCSLISVGQTHDWAEQIRFSQNGEAYIVSQAVDDSSNIYIGGLFKDSLYLPGDTFFFSGTSQNTFYIAKFDGDGNYIWGKAFVDVKSAFLRKIVINSKSEVVLFGSYSTGTAGGLSFGNFTLNRSAGIFVAFLSPNGTFTGAKDLGFGDFTQGYDISLNSKDEILASYYLNGFRQYGVLDGSSASTGTGFVNVVAKYSADATALRWSKVYDRFQVDEIPAVTTDKNDQVYFSIVARKNSNINGISIGNSTPAGVVWTRSNGTIVKTEFTPRLDRKIKINSIAAIDSSRIYLSGFLRADSMIWQGDTIRAQSSNPNREFYWIGESNALSSFNWTRTTSHQVGGVAKGFSKMSLNGDFLYFSFIAETSSFRFGSLQGTSYVDAVMSKLDRLGNVLWYISLPINRPANLSPIGDQDLAYSESASQAISLTPFTLSPVGVKSTPFLTRTFDYSITRGEVSKGPYCAGDTIIIPYRKVGAFDTANVFIAELSDEQGEFQNGAFFLGELKTTTDSVIIGQLPLFRVKSSDKYRIRVRSTAPAVQSYFKLDTLNLLIYSTDDADPGPDTTICFGDSVQLQTFGGTKWTWSPNYNITDSTERNPFVFPEVDTLYTIIIADSSGCGEPDTADIRVFIQKEFKLNDFRQNDTLFCLEDSVRFNLELESGGLTTYINWYNATSAGSGPLLKTTIIPANTIFRDSIQVEVLKSDWLFLEITDSCSRNISKTLARWEVFKSAQFDTIPNLTRLCPGDTLFVSTLDTSSRKGRSYQWKFDLDSGKYVGDRFAYLPADTGKLLLSVIDVCTDVVSEQTMNLRYFDPLKLKLDRQNPADALLCRNENLVLKATVQGGNPNLPVVYTWKINSGLFTGDTLDLNPTDWNSSINSDSLRVITTVYGNCSGYEDSLERVYRVPEQVQIRTLKPFTDTVCRGTTILPARFELNGYQPFRVEQRDIVKGIDVTINKDSLVIDLSTAALTEGVNTLSFVVFDQCGDSAIITSDVYLPAPIFASIAEDTLCIPSNASVTLDVTIQGGIGENDITWLDESSAVLANSKDWVYSSGSVLAFEPEYQKVTVLVEDDCAGAQSSDSLVLCVNPVPIISLDTIANQRRQQTSIVLCNGQDTLLTPQVYFGNNQDLVWSQNGLVISQSAELRFGQFFNTQQAGEIVLRVYLQDNSGRISDTLTVRIETRQALQVFLPEDTIICSGSLLDLKPLGQGGRPDSYTYTWWQDGNTISNDSVLQVTTAGVYRVELRDGCSIAQGVDSIRIDQYEPLSARILGNPKCDEVSVLRAELSGGKDSATWSTQWWIEDELFTSDQLEIRPTLTNSGEIRLILSDNCTNPADTATVVVECKNTLSWYPITAFSPNGDGINDTYYPLVVGGPILHYKVYNRWGERVFEGIEEERWDGESNGKRTLPGSYMVIVKALRRDGEEETQVFVLNVVY